VKACAALAAPTDFLPLDGPSTRAVIRAYPDLPATQPCASRAGACRRCGWEPATPTTWCARATARRWRRPPARSAARAELRVYPGQGHVGVLLALSRAFSRRAPVLDDMAGFLRANL
jgi:hypothetical protein